jgi:hypothetical protein
MQARLNTYKKEGALAIKHMWYVILIFRYTLVQFYFETVINTFFLLYHITHLIFSLFYSFLDIIVSLAVTVKNSTAVGGYKGASFAAVWYVDR